MEPADAFLAMRSWRFTAGDSTHITSVTGAPGFTRVWINPRPRRGLVDALKLMLDPRDGARVGYAVLGFDGTSVELADIKIYPWFQGRGIGSAFLSDLVVQLQKAGIKNITGRMSGDLPRLAKWYASSGFTVDGEEIKLHL